MKIIHRCNQCNYPEEYHPHVAYRQKCSVPVEMIKVLPPELIPTFDTAGRLVETVTKPGTIWPGGHPKMTACSCDKCWEVYRESQFDLQ